MNKNEESYWTNRYQKDQTGWDIGYPSTPIKTYIDQLENKELKILIPGAGNAYEAQYMYNLGFKNVNILDISKIPLETFKLRNPDFPEAQILHDDFFEHSNTYDLIIEQTFFCSFIPSEKNRIKYAEKMHELLKPKGKLVGLWFNFPLNKNAQQRPFGGNKRLYLSYFNPFFTAKIFEPCYNSISERSDKELFGIFNVK